MTDKQQQEIVEIMANISQMFTKDHHYGYQRDIANYSFRIRVMQAALTALQQAGYQIVKQGDE